MKIMTFRWMTPVLFIAGFILLSTNIKAQKVAAIGDFGEAGSRLQAVTDLVYDLDPELIITMGDNNYGDLTPAGFQENVGDYYDSFINSGNFYPCIGNHDYANGNGDAYFDYFDLPSTPADERYYDFVRGNIHFFALNSNCTTSGCNNSSGGADEPHGIYEYETQGIWLKNKLASSTAKYKLVYLHHSPYSSSDHHGSDTKVQWPFAEWGATAVMSGHDHHYEHLLVDGIPYFVNGVGGRPNYSVGTSLPETQFIVDDKNGAMLINATPDNITFEFWSVDTDNDDEVELEESIIIEAPSETPNIVTSRSISTDADDVEERSSNGSLYYNSSDLEINRDESNDNNKQHIGLRFSDLNIPQGANIVNAHIEFTAQSTSSGDYEVKIRGDVSPNAAPFSGAYSVTNRPLTDDGTSVTWVDSDQQWVRNEVITTPDIASVIQEIVNLNAWSPNNNLAIVIEEISGDGYRDAYSYKGSSSKAPRLVVTYNMNDNDGEEDTETFETKISAGYNDAEERVSDGDMNLTSSDLEFGKDYSTEQHIGLRFKNISIPQGSEICDAYIEFTAKGTTSSNFTVEITGHDDNDASGFYDNDYNIFNRDRTSADVDWSFGSTTWTTNEIVQSPNISSIIQEIVDRGDWVFGNDMAFIFETKNGNGTRRVYSRNGSSTKCAKLVIVYGSCGSSNKITTEESFYDIKIYPNPAAANAEFNIELDEKMVGNPIQINIYNPNGQLVFREESEQANHLLNVPTKNMQSGIYFIQVQGKDFQKSYSIMISQ